MRGNQLLLAVLTSLASPAPAQTPGGGSPWFGFGPVDTAYALSTDTTVAFSGHHSLLLQSLPGANASTWIASIQIVDARMYRGKRIKIVAHLRTQAATSAGFWLIVEGAVGKRSAILLSDSLTPALRGTTAWRPVAFVFDVSTQASCIRYGSMLNGTGAVWLDAITFAAVPRSVRPTARAGPPEFHSDSTTTENNCQGMVAKPMDLGFEEAP